MFSPIALLADSRLLFGSKARGAPRPLLARLGELAPKPLRRAAYLGASNGDQPEFYELFASAMSAMDLTEHRHVKAAATAEDVAFLAEADLVLLAGGDVGRGLRAFASSDVGQTITSAYLRGAQLIGVSAGAVQLGDALRFASAANGDGSERLTGFRFVPFLVDAHAEPDWSALRRAVVRQGDGARGIGIPRGGGAIFHRDGSLEAVQCALVEFVAGPAGGVTEALIVPEDSTS